MPDGDFVKPATSTNNLSIYHFLPVHQNHSKWDPVGAGSVCHFIQQYGPVGMHQIDVFLATKGYQLLRFDTCMVHRFGSGLAAREYYLFSTKKQSTKVIATRATTRTTTTALRHPPTHLCRRLLHYPPARVSNDAYDYSCSLFTPWTIAC